MKNIKVPEEVEAPPLITEDNVTLYKTTWRDYVIPTITTFIILGFLATEARLKNISSTNRETTMSTTKQATPQNTVFKFSPEVSDQLKAAILKVITEQQLENYRTGEMDSDEMDFISSRLTDIVFEVYPSWGFAKNQGFIIDNFSD